MRREHHAAHRDKRPYQPPITTFFAPEPLDDFGESDVLEERGPGPITRVHQHHASSRTPRDTLVPDVPTTVQADLLSVGMRVRKSVPEGYKTHKTSALPSIQTTMAKSHSHGDAFSVKPPRDPVPDAVLHQRELLPFCGLNKIGGYAEQPVTNVHLYGGTGDNGARPVNMFPLPAEAFNQPFSSQDSSISISSSTDSLRPNPMNPHKRNWSEDEASPSPPSLNSNFIFAHPMKLSEDEVPVSPLSANPAHSLNSLPQAALRPFAQPKTRRQTGRMVDVDGAIFKESDIAMDVENADQRDEHIISGGSSSDFGDAPFLRPWNGQEIEMGGV